MIQKVLIIQHKMIGDVLTSSILCEAIKNYNPTIEVHYLINSHTLPVLQNNPFIDKKIVYTPEIEKSRKAKKQLRKAIRLENYDTIIDVYSKLGSAQISKASKARKTIGYKKWYTKSAYTDVYTYHYTPLTEAGLAIENRMKLLQAIDTEFPKALKPKLYITEEEIVFAKNQLAKYTIDPTRKLYMINILGSSKEKTYPLPYLAKLLDVIVAKTDGQLLFNYIPKQVDQVKELYDLCTPKTQLNIQKELYGKSLRAFIALTSQCDALIGNEGGAINMAKALNIPTFAIFSPWIRKAAWALYENDKNVAIHLQDYNSELYAVKTLKEIKKKQSYYYTQLAPDLISSSLQNFLSKEH